MSKSRGLAVVVCVGGLWGWRIWTVRAEPVVEAPRVTVVEPRAAGLAPSVRRTGVVKKEALALPRVSQSGEPCRVRGRVLDESGNGINALLHATLDNWTIDAGGFELLLPPGDHVITVQESGWLPTTIELSLGIGESVDGIEIVLTRGATIAGNIIDAQDRRALDGCTVAVRSTDPKARSRGNTHSDVHGSFQISGLASEAHGMQVSCGDRLATRLLGPIAAGTTGMVIEMERKVVVRARIVRTSAEDESEADIESDGPYLTIDREEDDTFSLFLERDKVYRVSARSDAGVSEPLTLEGANAPATIELKLASAGGIRGTVLQGDHPAVDHGVSIHAIDGYFHETTGDDGGFQIGGLVPGEYEVCVTPMVGDETCESSDAECTTVNVGTTMVELAPIRYAARSYVTGKIPECRHNQCGRYRIRTGDGAFTYVGWAGKFGVCVPETARVELQIVDDHDQVAYATSVDPSHELELAWVPPAEIAAVKIEGAIRVTSGALLEVRCERGEGWEELARSGAFSLQCAPSTNALLVRVAGGGDETRVPVTLSSTGTTYVEIAVPL